MDRTAAHALRLAEGSALDERRLSVPAFLDRLPDVVFRLRVRPTALLEYVSAGVERLSGYPREALYADPLLILGLVHPDDRAAFRAHADAPTGDPLRVRWQRADGRLAWVEYRTSAVCDDEGVVVALDGVVRELADPSSASVRRVGDLELDALRRIARIGGRELRLTPAEFKLLLVLTEEPGRVVPRGELAARLARNGRPAREQSCEVHVSHVRKKIELEARNPKRLVSIRGRGYAYVAAP